MAAMLEPLSGAPPRAVLNTSLCTPLASPVGLCDARWYRGRPRVGPQYVSVPRRPAGAGWRRDAPGTHASGASAGGRGVRGPVGEGALCRTALT
ncbi:hypothetical protein NDU88_008440 [Pleurodeles waltl]|uniref:Uncharacterized protein n=1 Tax=Pleurodeles waltl TaxID=8319 RepID=A0AAV7QUJ5_PLEWA|nr:hypothetical protein NDU88_008440 [Pleurodeles waltl]